LRHFHFPRADNSAAPALDSTAITSRMRVDFTPGKRNWILRREVRLDRAQGESDEARAKAGARLAGNVSGKFLVLVSSRGYTVFVDSYISRNYLNIERIDKYVT